MKPQWIEVRFVNADGAPVVLINLAHVWAIDPCEDGMAALNFSFDHSITVTTSYEQIRKALNVVSSAPQSTMEGVFAMGDPEKTDLAVEIANLVGKAIEQGADVEEVKAVLNEVLDELEAQDDGDEEELPAENGENA